MKFKIQLFIPLCILVFLQLFIFQKSFSQQSFSPPIKITGKVFDKENPSAAFPLLMIINYTTQHGIFGNSDGTFITSINKKDTLIISATGYTLKKICFNDSILKNNYEINIPLVKLHRDLEEVAVFPERDLDKIENDIQKLGYNENDYQLTGVDAWAAPLDALYQEFSKKEKDKRKAAQLKNESQRNALLKELLRMYEKNNLVKIKEKNYDNFIEYLNISDEMIKFWTQYELAIYIKSKYERFEITNEINR